MRSPIQIAGLLLLALAVLLGGCATNPVTGDSDFVLMSEAQEIALGRKMHREILAQQPAYQDPALAAYVRRVGNRLAGVSHRSNLVFHFTVLLSLIHI